MITPQKPNMKASVEFMGEGKCVPKQDAPYFASKLYGTPYIGHPLDISAIVSKRYSKRYSNL